MSFGVGHALRAPMLVAVAALALTSSGCRCSESRSDSQPSKASSPAAGQSEARQAALPEFRVQRAGAAGVHPVIIALSSGSTLCDAVTSATAGAAHVICGKGLGPAAATALRQALTRLKAEAGDSVQRGSVVLLATDEHASAVRMLVSQEPPFFSQIGVWAGPLAVSQLGSSFIVNVGPRGAESLAFVGRTADELGPLSRVGQRNSLRVVSLAGDGHAPSADQVRQVLAELRSASTPPAATEHPASAAERPASGSGESAPNQPENSAGQR